MARLPRQASSFITLPPIWCEMVSWSIIPPPIDHPYSIEVFLVYGFCSTIFFMQVDSTNLYALHEFGLTVKPMCAMAA